MESDVTLIRWVFLRRCFGIILAGYESMLASHEAGFSIRRDAE